MPLKVLLTGGAGYIGSHTAIALFLLGHDVVLYDNLSNSKNEVIGKIEQIIGRQMLFIEGDVRDTALLKTTLSAHKIEAVIHFAGLKAVGESVGNPIDYFTNNVQGTISLIQAMHSEQIKTLVFSSSATVYGEPKYLPLDEVHPTSAINPYGRSKIHIEELLSDVAKSDVNWRIACLRYFNPVGAHQSGIIGDNPKGAPNNLMPYIAQVAIGLRSKLNVFGGDYATNDGTGIRDYIHVMDLAEGHAAALNFLNQANGWHAINLGTGKGYSVLEVVSAFEKASGSRVPYSVSPRRDGDVAACYADPLKAGELLSWKATRTLEEMCDSTWLFQKSAELKII